MIDEAANPDEGAAPEADTAEEGHVEAEADVQEQEPEESGEEEGSEPSQDDYEEVDYEGERYQLPKKLKSALMRQTDYTQKTMKLSEERKAQEAAAKEFNEYQENWRANADEYMAIRNLETQIKEYEGLDWIKLIDDDHVQASKLQMQYNQLVNERNRRAQDLHAKENDRRSKAQQAAAKREEEGRAVLLREIKGWSPELERNLKDYAVSNGVPAERAAEHKFAHSPAETKILHKAFLYDQLMKKQAQKPKEPQAEVKPAVQIKQGKTNKAPQEYRVGMSHTAYDKWRESQKRK